MTEKKSEMVREQPLRDDDSLPFSKHRQGSYTYGDYVTWPDDYRYEIIDGTAYAMTPAPMRVHQDILLSIATEFSNYLKGKTCKAYIAPFDVRIPKDRVSDNDTKTVVQPDLSVICDPNKLDDKGCNGSPDLVVEVISPSSLKRDIAEKRALYERVGVREYWVVYPNEQVVLVYYSDEDGTYNKFETYGIEDKIKVSIFDDFTVPLKTVFSTE
jgi:Uma2 family endonuclease